MNFLVLTPDGVGSTYLQRALTVYLNASGEDYYNTHEILNGLALDRNNNLFKVKKRYTQSISDICKLLDINQAKIVSRLAQYHVENRLANDPPLTDTKEDYEFFYSVCNDIYDKKMYCIRDPFEYALSWSIRNISGKFNVYSIKERIETHEQDVSFNIDLKYMESKLNQYNRYLYWVKDYFPEAIEVEYEDIHNDIDLLLKNLTGIDFDMRKDWGTSLQEYSTLLYKISRLNYNPSLGYSDKLIEYQNLLIEEKKLRNGMPIKSNTLEEKSKKVINFSSSLELYNNWTESSNEFSKIEVDEISKRITKENKIYELVD